MIYIQRMKNLLITMRYQRGFFVFIVCFLKFCQISNSIGLTIDNQLIVVANDCYTRIAIGSKFSDMDIFTNVAVRSISECEDECSKKRNSCNAFAFGIGVKGNGTCALSTKMPKAEELQPHADYDIYVRSQRSPHCEPDRLYKMGSGIEQEGRNETRPITRFGSGLLGPTMPSFLSSPGTKGSTMSDGVNEPVYLQGYIPSFDDERRISDILRNRNPIPPASNSYETNNGKIDNYNYAELSSIYPNRKSTFGQKIHLNQNLGRPDFNEPFRDFGITRLNFASNLDNDFDAYRTYHNRPFEVFSKPILVHDGVSKDNKPPADFAFWNNHDQTKYRNTIANRFNSYRDQGNNKNQGIITKTKQNELIIGNYNGGKISRPIISNTYAFGTNGMKVFDGGFKDTEIWNPGLATAFRGFGARIPEKSKTCYRRLLSGKKSLELHVRRAMECERLEDCHRACDYEKRFVCEGFNYRRIGHGTRGMCEMTSVPYSRMDIHQDFVSDPQCDYYERDPNCLINTSGPRPPWWNEQTRPSQSYGPPYSSHGRPDARPYTSDRSPLNEVPRPLDYDRRPTNEIPRPLDYNRRPISRPPSLIYGDSHRDFYDTYDQRSYPRDQGAIQDGFPLARPEDRFTYGSRFPPRRPADDFYNRNLPWAQYPKFPDRRIDHGPTQDIGTNEINSYLPYNRKNSNRDWDSYGTVYGGSYGYDTNYVNKFDIPKYYPKSQPKPPYPFENDHFYGEFYNYGGAFGYGDNYIPVNQDSLYGGTGKSDECSVRAGAGFRLSRGVVQKTYLTPNLDQCESLCINEKSFICMSFSYRYNVAPTDPTDNCLLSDVSYKDLNFYTDLEPDRDYDIYAMIANSGTCTKRKSNQHPPDECFWRVRSGFGMPADVTRKSMIVNNLGECQVECTMTHDFTCRSFAFKYGLEQDGKDIPTNCYLSDWPSQDINPVNMPDMDGAELYERGSFGRGCKPYTVPFFNMGRLNSKQPSRGDEVCYSGYHRPCKLTPYAVLLATYVNSEQDCRQKCSKMRASSSAPCMSYSYKLTTHGTEENCLLSDVSIRDLRPGLDYIHDNDHVLYAWKDLDPHCMIMGYSIDNENVFGGSRPLLPAPSRPSDFNPEANYPDDMYPRPFVTIPKPNGHHGVRPFDPDRPDPVRPYRPGGGYVDKFEYDVRPSGPGYGFGPSYPSEYPTFQHYTVNGYPCKRGTKCERNKIAGFWSCETEEAEEGSWDYCCEPAHQCGFSQGYHYPWCYVGMSEDQWRPCSEKYYPYLPSPRPMHPPMFSNDDHRDSNPQDPNYYGRHWPITYLHREPPPNCTDSLASANNNENRHLNGTTSRTIEKPSTTVDTANTTSTKMRRQSLQSRTALASNMQNDRAILSRKIGTRIIANNAQNHRRVAKIERISSTEPFITAPVIATVAPYAAVSTLNGSRASKSNGGRFKHKQIESDIMIRVPLITANNSLPITA